MNADKNIRQAKFLVVENYNEHKKEGNESITEDALTTVAYEKTTHGWIVELRLRKMRYIVTYTGAKYVIEVFLLANRVVKNPRMAVNQVRQENTIFTTLPDDMDGNFVKGAVG